MSVERIANVGSILLLISQLLCLLSMIQLRHEKHSLWLLVLAHAFLLASIGCVVYETLFFGL